MRPPVAATRDAAGKWRRRAGGTRWAPEDAIAPGQACVFYKGSRVLGGGWIARAETAATGRRIGGFPPNLDRPVRRATLTSRACLKTPAREAPGMAP